MASRGISKSKQQVRDFTQNWFGHNLPRAVKVRKMTDSHRPKWLELRRALWPDCPPERHRLEMEQWQRSEGIVLLAEGLDGQALGFAEISIRREHVEGTLAAPVAYLEAWYVIPGYRRKGVGQALIKTAERWALETGFSEIASDADCGNHDAIRAHLGLGFREVARSVHFVKPINAKRRTPRRSVD